ncbi:MAG: diaminopimelate epimerase [Candidatus Omnitrophica bacterium]|nr:diaminopimelate epimerase [Candidatus Omnitrophota bacterium]
MKTIKFTKMVASGNDFVVIDAITAKLQMSNSKLTAFAKAICNRKYGAGADGLIILEKSRKTKFKMRIFNPDGSNPKMCGNGARCAALFFQTKNAKSKANTTRFETGAGILEAQITKSAVKLKMTDPKDLWPNIDLNIGDQFYKVHYLNTGVPHAVFFVGNVDTINVRQVGKQIRFHKQFHPEGANANFAQIVDDKKIRVRTYERGVEDETLACGTGSVASAVISAHLNLTKKRPVLVGTRSGEELKVYFDCKDKRFSNVWLEGSAEMVYEGTYLA